MLRSRQHFKLSLLFLGREGCQERSPHFRHAALWGDGTFCLPHRCCQETYLIKIEQDFPAVHLIPLQANLLVHEQLGRKEKTHAESHRGQQGGRENAQEHQACSPSVWRLGPACAGLGSERRWGKDFLARSENVPHSLPPPAKQEARTGPRKARVAQARVSTGGSPHLLQALNVCLET